jgi:hypothetical protein
MAFVVDRCHALEAKQTPSPPIPLSLLEKETTGLPRVATTSTLVMQ